MTASGEALALSVAPGTVGDLISVPRVRTVIQLADRRDPALRDEILSSFVLTGEVTFNLAAILSSVAGGRGRGFFLQGSFGCGKSHFLTVLTYLLDNPEAWRHLPVEGSALAAVSLGVAGRRFLPVPVSLVEHSSRERLEDVVLDSLAAELTARGLPPPALPRFPAEYRAMLEERHPEALARFAQDQGLGEPSALFEPGCSEKLERFLAAVEFPFRMRYDRREAFEGLASRLEQGGYAGLVLLVDELSEYLRSKADARGFNEEIRFLQFLGEYGEKNPMWVVATLQERIEDTGEITQSAFNKIKDRYPGRLALTGKHVEDLVGKRLLPKRPGAAARLAELHRAHVRAFAGFDPGLERFVSIYPVHPTTLFWLDELKALLSQHRGVVDFVSARVGGDPRRRIPGLLAEPDTTLLTPDVLFDHFTPRIKEMVETNPFVEVVYRYFETEVPGLFPDLAEATVALRLVKLLILGAISPVRRDLAVGELASMLMHRITAVSPEANCQYVADLLERMRSAGAYLAVEKHDGPFKDVYRIDLEADVNLVIRRRVAYLRSTLFSEDRRLYSRLGQFVDPPHLPLSSLGQANRRRMQVMWQSTRREGFLLYLPPEELTSEKAAAIDAELATGDGDFVFVVLPLGTEDRLGDAVRATAMAVWVPASVSPPEREDLAQILAKLLLLEEQAQQTGTLPDRIRKQLTTELESDKRRVREIFERAYFNGKLLAPGGKTVEVSRWGYIPLEQMAERAAAMVLEHRFPGHMAIAPQTSQFVRDRESDLIEGFFKPGELDPSRPGARALQVLIEGYLRPLGMMKKAAANRLQLAVDGRRSESVRMALELVPEGSRTELAALARAMRKGPLGMGREQWRLMLLGLVFSGQVGLFAEGKRLGPDKLTTFWIERATEVSKGDLVGGQVRALLAEVPFLSVVKKAGEQFNVGIQQAAWDELVAYRRAAAERKANLEAALEKALALPSLEALGLARSRQDFQAWGALLEEVRVSYPAREGLERFAAHWSSTPGLRGALERLESLGAFLRGGPEKFVAAAAYLRHPGLVLPPDPAAEGCKATVAGLRELLSDPALPFRQEAVAELTGAFDRLLAAYGPLYAAHHERQHAAARFEPLRRLRTGREYGLLADLSAALGEGAGDEFPRLQRVLGQVLGRACRGFDPVALKVAPVCRCGLTLGDVVELPDVAALHAALESSLADCVRAMQTGRIREALTAYAASLQEAGRPEQSALLLASLALEPAGAGLADRLSELAFAGLGGLVREAISGRLAIVARDLDELVESLLDRSFEPAELQATLSRWLGTVPAGAIVRVRSGRAGKQQGLLAIVEEAFPDLLAVLRDLGEELFVELVFAAEWAGNLGLEPRVLDDLLERPGLSAHAGAARAFASYLAERLPELAGSLREALERRLERVGRAEKYTSLALTGRDRDGLLDVVAAPETFKFVPRAATALYVRHLREADGAALERLQSEGAQGDYRRTLAAAGGLELALRDCEKALNKTLEAPGWETLYRNALAGLELALLEVRTGLAALGVEAVLPLERVSACVARLDEAFRTFHATLTEKLAAGGPGLPLTPADLAVELVTRLRKRLAPSAAALVVIDAMRHDFFEHLRAGVLPLAQGTFRHVETLSSWAFTPTTTAPNLEAILTGRRPAAQPALAADDEAPPPRTGRAALEEFTERSGLAVVKYNALDDRLHVSRDGLDTLYREAAMALAPALLPWLDRLAPRTLVLFTADHGFRERPHWQARDASRYTHGGASPFEVLVPVGVYLKVD